jgi:DNA-binding transcriptional LysR family regulator
MDEMRWGWLASFLVVAREGSLSRASGKMGVSQSTLSRHVQALEELVGFALFDRHARGLRLTAQGVALAARVEAVGEEVDGFLREAVGLNVQVGGAVRVSVGEVAGVELLIPWVKRFREEWPQITLDWFVTNEVSNLLAREAEVAVRMGHPGSQQELIAKQAGLFPLGFFASKDYLEAHGPIPTTVDGVRKHALIGYDKDDAFIRNAARLGERFVREDFGFRSDSVMAQIRAIRAGVGVGVILTHIGDRDPELTRLLPQLVAAVMPVWVVAHKDVRNNPRVRVVFDSLYEEVRALCQGVV